MERDSAAKDVAAMVTLIDDPRHRVSEAGTTNSRPSRPRRSSICGCSGSPRSAATRSRPSSTSSPARSPIISTSCARARASQTIVKDELAAIKRDFATPRRTVILDQEGEMEDEDLIQREDMVVTVSARRLRQARAALDLPRATARWQRPRRHADARGGFRHPPLRRLDAHSRPVLLLARAGLQGEGLAGCRWRRRRRAARP